MKKRKVLAWQLVINIQNSGIMEMLVMNIARHQDSRLTLLVNGILNI